MPVVQQAFTAEDVRDNPEALYVFPDNALHADAGDLAEALRSLPNALGVVVKESAQRGFDDRNFDLMGDGFDIIWSAAEANMKIVIHPAFNEDMTIFAQAPKAQAEFLGMLETARLQAEIAFEMNKGPLPGC